MRNFSSCKIGLILFLALSHSLTLTRKQRQDLDSGHLTWFRCDISDLKSGYYLHQISKTSRRYNSNGNIYLSKKVP